MKTVFISGGTSGINLGVAIGFARRGANVLVFGRNAEKSEAAATRVRAESSATVVAGSADVRDYGALTQLFASSAEKLGAPDVVIAGAAGNFVAPAVGISANGFKAVIDIDLLGSYNVFRAAYDVVKKPGASLIAITAPQAVQPMPSQVHVCAAKAGVNMVVKVLAMEWGKAGIRVNAISPGPILGTEGVERMAPSDESKQRWLETLALRRFGAAQDIAEAALFLSSDAASYITGTILDCDGGMGLGNSSGDFLHVVDRKEREK